jgi:putative flippase GtrA
LIPMPDVTVIPARSHKPRPLAAEALRFLAVGAVATALQYAILVALVRWAGWDAVPASTLGFAISMWLNYTLNRRYTFASDRPHAQALPRFVFTALCGLGLTAAGMYILVSLLRLDYLVAQVIVTVAVTAWNFALNRWWSFRRVDTP